MSVDWLLTSSPRPAQAEALLRAQTGLALLDTRDGEPNPRMLPHHGGPARGYAHFMEMRLGKTPTALNEYMLLKRDHNVRRLLVLSPAKYRDTWGLECSKFGIDVPQFVYTQGCKKQLEAWIAKNDEGVIIAHYEMMRTAEAYKMIGKWLESAPSMVVCDESVIIKGENSGFFKKALELGKEADYTRALTGLPTPQGAHDLWAQLRFCKQFSGDDENAYHPFRNRYADRSGFKGAPKGIRKKNVGRLDALLLTCAFRANRKDWDDHIETDYELCQLPMTPKQIEAYNSMDEDFMMMLSEDSAVTADQVVGKRLKLQQISSGFIYDEFKVPHDLLPFDKTPKFMDLVDRLENIPGKVIVIAQYRHTIAQLVEHLKEWQPAVIGGNVQMKTLERDVTAEKARFNGDPNCKVMIGQPQAIKYGHTLMGSDDQPCLSICYFENSYNFDDRAQTEQRPQGRGQVAAIHVVDYYTSKVDKLIMDALQKKKDVAQLLMAYYKLGEGDGKAD